MLSKTKADDKPFASTHIMNPEGSQDSRIPVNVFDAARELASGESALPEKGAYFKVPWG